MHYMIISGNGALIVGQTYHGVTIDGVWIPEQPFHVLRVATREEWLEHARASTKLLTEFELTQQAKHHTHFYQVSVD